MDAKLRWVRALLLAAVALGGSACGSSAGDDSDGRPYVVGAFYPLAFVASEVGGDRVVVESLTPAGVEPHDLELTSQQVRDLTEADLVVYLGDGFQPAIEDVVSGLDDERTLDALEGQRLLAGNPVEAGGGQADPHVWLDPTRVAAMADEIAARLAELDPGGAATYRANAGELRERLLRLDREFSATLSECRMREFVTSHEAFGYLAARYDLEQVGIAGVDPEAEPSPGRLAEVADFVADHHVTTIFFEELAPPDLAETLARETGAAIEVLSPLETPPEQGDYLDVMRTNLDRLSKALDCD